MKISDETNIVIVSKEYNFDDLLDWINAGGLLIRIDSQIKSLTDNVTVAYSSVGNSERNLGIEGIIPLTDVQNTTRPRRLPLRPERVAAG